MPDLAILSLTLSHFRSHHRTEIEVDARPVAIHGPNGAGKTNILEAISLLSPGRGLRRAASEDLIRRPEALGWKIAATLRSGPQIHEIDTRAEPGSPRQLRIDGKTAPQTALGRIARILWLVPSMDRLWIEGAEGRRRFLDRMTLSFEPAHAEASLAYDRAMRERNRLLKDGVTDPHWYAALEAQMAENGTKIRAHRATALARIAGAQEDAETVFPAADLTLEEPEAAEDLAQALARSRPADLRAGRSLVGPHRADLRGIYRAKGVDAAQCSTGEQKALLISLILANSRALAEETGLAPILLLDEVAAHLDPNRRAALYDEICALGGQAWLTGTEKGLYDALGDRAQYLELTDTDGASTLRAL
ncbi:DNA replication/repair protein RecF [Ovoidimarina sediminis]|uniref:DNA replication/repair protein RecF n=1 Tax=Ovoidimarina sediminis TaxID=3079856 RepID=UPI00290C1A73|nr:DNA replication/repair protein RecF [Rhodophyticola sp. MJ-SS7]MDU8942483.1 DNA replication/repair protein RecF [Rhodophyticola sp. MJ-SS7]